MKRGTTPALILAGALFSLLSFVILYSNLPILSFSSYKPRPHYWDLHFGMTFLWDCFQESGLQIFSVDPNTFPSLATCRNFNYGYFSVASFGLFRTISTNPVFWGVLQILVFGFVLARTYLLKMERSVLVFSIFALFSPGIFLLEASGNMDMEIVIFILLAGICIQNGKDKIALTLICITALFKFYTAPILLIVTFFSKKRTSQIYGVFLMLITGGAILYQMIQMPIPPFPIGAQNKFGAMIIANYSRKAGVEMNQGQGQILGIILLIAVLGIIFFFYRTSKQTRIQSLENVTHQDEFLLLNFLVMATTSVVCYTYTMNVDYRLVFVALAGISLLQINQVKITYATSLFPYFWLTSLWLSFPFAYLSKYIGFDLQPIGDVALIGTISYFIFQAFFVFKDLFGKAKHKTFN
jgi:hypothetical protein